MTLVKRLASINMAEIVAVPSWHQVNTWYHSVQGIAATLLNQIDDVHSRLLLLPK
jgi:hypothetical protein